MALPTCPKSGEAFLRELKRTAWVFRAQILFVSGLSSPPPHSLDAKVLTSVFWANSHVRPPTPELGRVTPPSWVCLSSYGEGRTYFISDGLHSQATPALLDRGGCKGHALLSFLRLLKIFLTYRLLWIYLVVPGFSCGLRDLFKLRHMVSSSLTKDCTGDPCIKSRES